MHISILALFNYSLQQPAFLVKPTPPGPLSHPPTITLDQPEASYGPPLAQTDLAHTPTSLSVI
jgi:hypothetical protein